MCAVTSWHRDHARKAIRVALTDRARGRPLPRAPWVAHQVSGPESVELLRQCWAVLDGPTGKRLRPALPELLANLSAHGDLVENRLPGHDRPPPRGASFNSARRITDRLDFLVGVS